MHSTVCPDCEKCECRYIISYLMVESDSFVLSRDVSAIHPKRSERTTGLYIVIDMFF